MLYIRTIHGLKLIWPLPPYIRTPVTTRSNNIVTIILIKTKQQQTKQPVSGLKLIWPLPPYTRTPVTTRSNNIVTIILIKTKQQQTKQPVSRNTIVFFFNQTDTKIFPSQVSNNIMITVQRTLSNEAMMLMMYIWIFITITLTLTLTLISILGTSAWSIYRISILGTSAWSIYRKCLTNYI